MKQCKQCTRVLPDTDEQFRPYKPRGTGIRKTVVGRNTVCRDCESLNSIAYRLFKRGPRTPKEHELFNNLPAYYHKLVDMGGKPIGVYARQILGELEPVEHKASSALGSALDMVKNLVDAPEPVDEEDTVMDGYKALLELELVEIPDVYQSMLETLLENSLTSNGKIDSRYAQIFESVAQRIDEYEDNYEW